MEKSSIIEALVERIDDLEKWRKTSHEEHDKDKGRKKPDEEVCPVCGGDLLWVEEGIVFCRKCNQYFENTEEPEE